MPFCTVAKDRPTGGPYQLCYELHGSGPNKVLLVMGLSGTMRAWDTTVRQLLARNGYEICIFDNRGIGHSDQPGPGYSVKDMAEDAYELLLHLGWTKDVLLAGVSMGGMISQELVLLAPPGTFGALVLISTHPGRTIPPLRTIWTFASSLLLPGTKSEEDQFHTYCKLVFALPWLDAEAPPQSGFHTNREMILHSLRETRKEKGVQSEQGRMGQLRAIGQHYVSPQRLAQIGALGIPVLVMTGTEDALIRPKNSYYIAKHIGAPLEVFKGAGHGLAQERPHRFHALMCATFAKSKGFVKVAQPDDLEKTLLEVDMPISATSL
ncbi:uncharacterized protein SPPG_04365 [Spizellomyces punctatus DAOM BR117]|uniref:Serine aminopeptidase S33 domain-containing protein n=1 Tax=Spizellomyces punctatus (strain DAOM BR117) TaxID=645134 RepID=A0A0L0HGT2_SPIPD|nr:uncharacterized protein SPPG_04365 [Spizellomyces punctatus DAOM BR117]KND00019.1 hypothetical protein SPPG_04365 [Spizellomyces punctatus DAOM BR117]|eukprot:XP_016608058.1 hypothetical protein SPPG_04365 [Spizellomyces punctatus DAOM BR117]